MNAYASRQPWRRLAVPAIMLVGGTVLTVASAVGTASAATVAALETITVVFTAAFWWLGRGDGDAAALAANRPDERQRSIDLGASALAGLVVAIFCLGAGVVSLARGGSGYPWVGLDALFGITYAVGFAVLRRR
jgi:hypothetical protein